MKTRLLTKERLKEVLFYNKESGKFIWLIDDGRAIIGATAGSLHKSGYIKIKIDGVLHFAQRLAWLYVEGYTPENEIDHIDQDKSNNKWSNLRHVLKSCNLRNCNIRSNNSSGITGVCWHNGKGKWCVQIQGDGKRIYLGSYTNFDDAVMARWDGEKRYNWRSRMFLSSSYKYLTEKGII